MQFSKTQLITLTGLVAGYGAVAAASNLLQFTCGLGVILGTATGLLFSTLRQQNHTPRSNRQLTAPWLVLVIGFVLMLMGLFVFIPAAERLAIEQYLIAQSQGFQFEDLEGVDGVGLGIMLLYIAICLPVSLLAGLIGSGCSRILKKAGIGRYSLASALMLSPLVSGTYVVFHFLLIHWPGKIEG